MQNYSIQQSFSRTFTKIIVVLLSLISLVFCSTKVVTAFTHENIVISNTTGSILVNGNQIDNLNITPSLVFNEIGDSITYQIPLSSTNNTSFQIINVSDDNTNPHITTSYSYDTEMNPNDKSIYVTLSYTNSLAFGEQLALDDIHITATIDETTPIINPDDESTPNPNTNNTTTNSDNANTPVPNTGTKTSSLSITAHGSQTETIKPYLIVGTISLIIGLFTIIPKKHRISFTSVSASLIVFTSICIISNHAYAENITLEININTSNITAIPIIDNPENVVTFSFPNIYNNRVTDRPSGTAPGNAIIMKTLDNKYVLLDTGPRTANIREVIYDELQRLQESDSIIIDYLIISHLDGDHYGNAVTLINDERFTFKNIILKHEQYATGFSKEAPFASITQTAANHNINIITSSDANTENYMNELIGTTNYDKLSEGMTIQVGNYLKLDFFNTQNVYDGKPCQVGAGISWTASTTSSSLFKTPDGKYVYFDGSEYPNVVLRTTETPIAKENGANMNRYFYAIKNGTHDICRSNPNAFGILAEITTTGLKKYAYFANDIENAGYSILASGANSAQIFENLSFTNGEFTTDITPYTIPSEINSANAIYDKLNNDAATLNVPVTTLLNNISIYQESHHGINNNEDALWKLNINRPEGIYAILENSANMANTVSWPYTKTYWYTLGNIPEENKLRVGDRTTDGIKCNINMFGTTNCSSFVIPTDANH